MRVFHQKNAAQGKQYYAASDYYEGGPDQLKGYWVGKLARHFGLRGEVQKEVFDRLVDNLDPTSGERLTQRNHGERRVLTDITFSAPKSVSLLWGVSQDQRLLDVVQQAATETFTDLEKDALTRVNHERGVLTTQKTGNLIGASWLHVTGRPVDGHPDPQLHVHGAFANATMTKDNRITAVDLSAVVRDSGYYEAIFQSRLAQYVEHLGYKIERSEYNFEIQGVSRSTIEKFSRRQAEIDQLAEELGITNPATKDKLAATTRQSKEENLVAIADLPDCWRNRLTAAETRQFKSIINQPLMINEKATTAKEAVDFAAKHLLERQSVVRERHLIRDALRFGIGDVTAYEIKREIKRRPWIRQGKDENALVTTREILEEEQALLAFARNGRGRLRPLARNHQIERDWLSDEQKKAVRGILDSTDRLQILRGVAGSGKTTLMKEAIETIEKHGKHVAVLAPTAEAAHGVLKEEAGFDANTLASFLKNEKAQANAQGGVIWVDEAGLIGMPTMLKLTEIAKTIDARIILSGDKRQHKAVERGEPLRLLEEQAGIKPHEIVTIRRQEDLGYREAVEYLSRGEIEEGFERLQNLGFVHETQDIKKRSQQIASDYADLIEAGKKTLVIAPAHAEREQITEAIRKELKSRGHIDKDERDFTILKSKRLTEVQRGDVFNYAPGDVVEFITRGRGGFKAGDRLTVSSVKDGQVWAASNRGRVEVPLLSPRSFDVYRPQQTKFAVGDRLRITKNRKGGNGVKRLNNGSLLALEGFTKDGDLKLSNGQTLSAVWGHLDHGITVTSYASQGKTFPRILLAQSSLSFPASSPEQAYVSASRGRERLDIYTDDVNALRQAISRPREVLNASELEQPQSEQEPARHSRLASRVSELRLRMPHYAKQQLHQLQTWLQHRRPEIAR